MSLTAYELAPGVTQVLDGDRFGATLVTGTTGALLFDTLAGTEPIAQFVRARADLPLTVVNSHGHFDHTGGNDQFPEVWLSPRDRDTLAGNETLVDGLAGDLRERILAARAQNSRRARVLDLVPGQRFDLGDTVWEAVALPGHTPGSMGLLCESRRLLLAGDAFTPQMCLFFPESLGVEEYRRTLDYAMTLPFDRFVLGHYAKLFPKALLEKFAACAALPGTARGYDFAYLQYPAYRGTLYPMSWHDPDVEDAVCIITKPAKT